jgi:hypothetical protein
MTIGLSEWKKFLNNSERSGELLHLWTTSRVGSEPRKKDVTFDERSHYLYENKQNKYILPTQNDDIFSKFSRM